MLRSLTMRIGCLVALGIGLTPAEPGAQEQTPVNSNALRVDTMEGMTGLFNLGLGAVRVLAVVSPGHPATPAGLEMIDSIMATSDSRRLRAYVVFVPMGKGDTQISALQTLVGSSLGTDRRVVIIWNESGSIARSFSTFATASDGKPPHNFYMVYDSDDVLKIQPTLPSYWADQRVSTPAPGHLDRPAFESEMSARLARLEDRVRDAAAGSSQ